MIIAITVVALAAMFAVLVMVAHRIERRRQAKIELALIDRIIATRRRRTEAEINAAWEKVADKARAEGRLSIRVPPVPAYSSQDYQARHKADDCRVIGMDMATAADETVAALVIHGVAVSRATASDAGVCVELASRSDTYQCEPSSDTGSSSGSDSYSTPSE